MDPKFTAGKVTLIKPVLEAASAPDSKVKVPVPMRLVAAGPLINKALSV